MWSLSGTLKPLLSTPPGDPLQPRHPPGPGCLSPSHRTTPLTKDYNIFYSHAAMSQSTNTRQDTNTDCPPTPTSTPRPLSNLPLGTLMPLCNPALALKKFCRGAPRKHGREFHPSFLWLSFLPARKHLFPNVGTSLSPPQCANRLPRPLGVSSALRCMPRRHLCSGEPEGDTLSRCHNDNALLQPTTRATTPTSG